MIDADVLARMYAHIVQGMAKGESTLATTDEEHSAAWDAISAEIEDMRSRGAITMFEIPSDQPDTVRDLFASMRRGSAPPQSTAPSGAPQGMPAGQPEAGGDEAGVIAMLRELQDGETTLDEVVSAFRARSWPSSVPLPPKTYAELAAREQSDRDPDPEGSFAEVAQAFYSGVITVDQYQVLVEAIAGVRWGRSKTD